MNSRNKIEGIKSHIWEYVSKWRGNIATVDFFNTVLAFVILRRLECIFEPYREKVLRIYERNKTQLNQLDLDEKIREALGGKIGFYICTDQSLQSLLEDNHLGTAAGLEHYINDFDRETAKQLFDFGIVEYANRLIYAKTYLPFIDTVSHLDMGYDISNDEFEQLTTSMIADTVLSGGRTSGLYYTGSDLCKLMASLVLTDSVKQGNATLYDPVCGTGNLLRTVQRLYGAPMLVCGQDWEQKMCSLNSLLWKATISNHGHFRASDILRTDVFGDKRFDHIVADLPLRVEIHGQLFGWDDARFPFGMPGNHDATWLFVQHIIAKMNSTGRAVFTCPYSLFVEDNNYSNAIRSWLLKNDIIQTIVALPGGLLPGTSIPVCLCLLNNDKTVERKNKIQIINAESVLPRQSYRKNRISDIAIKRIIELFSSFEQNEYSHIAENTEFLQYVVNVNQPERDVKGNVVLERGEKKANLKKTIPVTVSATEKDVTGYINRTAISHLDRESWIDFSSIREKCIIDIRAPFNRTPQLPPLQLLQSDMNNLYRRTMALFEDSLNTNGSLMVYDPSDFNTRTCQLGSVVGIVRSRMSATKRADYESIPVLTLDQLRGFENRTDDNTNHIPEENRINEGDTLVLLRGENAGEVFHGKPGGMPSTMAKIELTSGVFIPDYLYLLIKSLEPRMRSMTFGNVIKQLNTSSILSIEVKIPSMTIQMEIVNRLAPKLKALDNLIPILGGSNRVTAQQYRQALIQDAIDSATNAMN